MKEKIANIIEEAISVVPFAGDVVVDLSVPEEPSFGHYSTNYAMRAAKVQGKKPLEFAKELAIQIKEKAPKGFFEDVQAAPPGFINFWLSKETIKDGFAALQSDGHYGAGDAMKGKTVMVEFTDPNPFKLFHIGHLMSNTIGESFARLYEAAGAKVIRANYQGDVGLHVAKAIWGMEALQKTSGDNVPGKKSDALAKMTFLGEAYALGSKDYEESPEVKEAIGIINEKIYSRSDPQINEEYDKGRKWSLDYFETIYQRLGTKFDHYFFESEMGKEGTALVLAHKDIFTESEGALVFPGEKYGLHTRVFVNSRSLPTYEAKELGLNKKKFELYHPDLSVIITGNEIKDYFKVLLKAMELILPDVASKTHHLPHGMLRLPSGKMSSRTGDVITAAALLDQIKAIFRERVSEKADLTAEERDTVAESVAIGAVKYSILKQNPGQDIVFDFEKSLSFEGDSGPYLQYAYARLKSIMRKAEAAGGRPSGDATLLASDAELSLIRKLFEFPDVVSRSRELYATSVLAAYLYKLAVAANKFYETTSILKDNNADRRNVRLALTETAANALGSGLGLLGIKALEKI